MTIDITASIDAARAEVDRYIDTDPVYAELMATYVELGETLEANYHITPDSPAEEIAEYEAECRSLVGRLIELGRVLDYQGDQRWARWRLSTMSMEEAA